MHCRIALALEVVMAGHVYIMCTHVYTHECECEPVKLTDDSPLPFQLVLLTPFSAKSLLRDSFHPSHCLSRSTGFHQVFCIHFNVSSVHQMLLNSFSVWKFCSIVPSLFSTYDPFVCGSCPPAVSPRSLAVFVHTQGSPDRMRTLSQKQPQEK